MLSDFDLRLIAFTPGGARIDPIPTLTAKYTVPDKAGTVTFAVSEEVYGEIPDLLEIAVELWNGTDWFEPDDARFLLTGDDDDDRDPTATHSLTAMSAAARYLAANWLVKGEAELVDGKRRFNSSTPGAIMATFIDECKARGVTDGLAWAPGFTYDFDADVDSDGVPWAEEISLGYEPGKVSAWMALQSLIDQGMCESRTSARVFQLFNLSTGADLTEGTAPVRLAANASTMPTKRSTADLLTHALFFGDEAFYLEHENDSAVDGYGRLETAIAQGGVSDEGTAILLANQTLLNGREVRRQITATEFAAAAQYLPGIDYQRGDWVEGLHRGLWTKFRVAEYIISRDAAGVVTVDAILNDRFISLLARMAKRQVGISGGAVAGGSGSPNTVDTRRPKAPAGLVLDSTGYWSNATPLSQLAANWTPVSQGENDVAIEIAGYEMWGRVDDGADESDVVTSTDVESATWSPFLPASVWLIKVRALSKAGVWGAFSDEESVTMEYPVEQVDTPTTPVLRSVNGVVEVTWDGLIATTPATNPPQQFRQINIETSGEEAGDYSRIGTLFIGNHRQNFPGMGVGSEPWFRFVAVDSLGRESDPSVAVSIIVVGLDGDDIIANSIKANSLEIGSITAEYLEAGLSGQITVSAETIVLQAGQIADLNDDLDATAEDLADLRLYVMITPDEVVITRPDSDNAFSLSNERAEMRQSGIPVSWWESGQFNVPSLVADVASIAKHKFEADPDGTGTVVRKL